MYDANKETLVKEPEFLMKMRLRNIDNVRYDK